jgi:hypothetical protein
MDEAKSEGSTNFHSFSSKVERFSSREQIAKPGNTRNTERHLLIQQTLYTKCMKKHKINTLYDTYIVQTHVEG